LTLGKGRTSAVLAAATAAFLLLGAGPVSSQGRIVIRGAAAGTHLRLAVAGSQLTVEGPMAESPLGCRLTRGHHVATCPLRDVGAIEVNAGPGGDRIEVLHHLPVPLTVYLGSGSDKLIGNGESDTCYPQGTARNRCIGGGGDDICISGPVNTDCVGGPGDDFCEADDGSDGCWGGPGQDVCYMGAGQDGCHGDRGNDRLFGGRDSDQLYGGAGDDYCDGGPGAGHSHECEAGPRR
jgi:hypothetical protein